MGKRIIQQARGKGSLVYRVRKKAFIHRIKFPMKEGEAEIVSIFHSAAHSAPLMKLRVNNEAFNMPAFNGGFVGQKITIGENAKPEQGNITMLKSLPIGTKVFNIERNPGDGGKMIRTAGSSALVYKKFEDDGVSVLMPNKKQVKLSGECRVAIGTIAGSGRNLKPIMKAGRRYYAMRARGKLWPRTSAVKFNAIDHPFGSGRGKRIKSKTAKRNAPPGARVGHIRPRRTGRRKR
jgi:large subunit ribosomal protein L2